MNKYPKHFRLFAVWLAVSLGLPVPAFALRPMGVDNAGLEEKITQSLSRDPFREVYPRVMRDLERIRDRRRQRGEPVVPSTILVTGEMGAGKTTFTSGDPRAGAVGFRRFLESNGFHVVTIDDEIFLKDRTDRQDSRALLRMDDPDLDRTFFDHLFEPRVFFSVFRKIGEFIRSKEPALSLPIEDPYDRQTGTRGRPIPLEITRDSVILFAGVLMEYWPKDINFDVVLSLDYDVNEDAKVLDRLETRESGKPSERRLGRDVLWGRVSGPELAAYRLYKQKHPFEGNYVIDNRDMKNPVLHELRPVTAGLGENETVQWLDESETRKRLWALEAKVAGQLGTPILDSYTSSGIHLRYGDGDEFDLVRIVDGQGEVYWVRNGSLVVANQNHRSMLESLGLNQERFGSNLLWIENFQWNHIERPDQAPYTNATVAAERLMDLRGKGVIDSGAGDGITALAALREGRAQRVLLIERDPELLEQARRNLVLNGYREGEHFYLIPEDLLYPAEIARQITEKKIPWKDLEWVVVSNIGHQPSAYMGVTNEVSLSLVEYLTRELGIRVSGLAFGGYLLFAGQDDLMEWPERDQQIAEEMGFEFLDEDITVENGANTALAWIAHRPAAAGLEEPVVKFQYTPGEAEKRFGLEPIKLQDWIPPLTALEAAALRAFLYPNGPSLPRVRWLDGVGNPSKPEVINSFKTELSFSDMTLLINDISNFYRSGKKYEPAALVRVFKERFGSLLLQGNRLESGAERERGFWTQKFQEALERIFIQRSEWAHPFRLMGLRRIGTHFFQAIPPGGVVEIPLEETREGVWIKFKENEFYWQWDPDDERSLAKRRWGIVTGQGETVFEFSSRDGAELEEKKGGNKIIIDRTSQSDLPYPFPSLRIGAHVRDGTLLLVERPTGVEGRGDPHPADEFVDSAYKELLPAGRFEEAVVKALEVLEIVLDEPVPSRFSRWEELWEIFSRVNTEISDERWGRIPGGKGLIQRLKNSLVELWPAEARPPSAFESSEAEAVESMVAALENFREDLGEKGIVPSFQEAWGLSPQAGSEAGLEEPVSLEINAFRYADLETKARSVGLKNY